MSGDLDETVLDELPVADDGSAAVMDLLRAKRAEHTASRTYDIDVPGYGGLLLIRCGPPPPGALARLRVRYERSRSPERDFDMNVDLLIVACVDVLYRPDAKAEPRPISLGDPMGLDERLAEGLGLDAKSGRELVRQLFGKAPSPELAVNSVMGNYLEWAAAVVDETDADFLGESPAASR
jgi:hypothetical protein